MQQAKTDPYAAKSASEHPNNDTSNVRAVVRWCWKETPHCMSRHSPQSIVGNPADCWIEYNPSDSQNLEDTYQSMISVLQNNNNNLPDHKVAMCTLGRYTVNLQTMVQVNRQTGFARSVQRLTSASSYEEHDRGVAQTTGPPFSRSTTTSSASSSSTSAVSMPPATNPTFQPSACWCWKETHQMIRHHNPVAIVGDPADGWIKYSQQDAQTLEAAYARQDLSPVQLNTGPYEVNLQTMEQTNKRTGFRRQVQRLALSTGSSTSAPAVAVATLISTSADADGTLPIVSAKLVD